MTDFICISDMRWQAFQHACPLPWRFVRKARVVFVEPPLVSLHEEIYRLEVAPHDEALTIVRLHVPGVSKRRYGHSETTLQPIYNELLGRYLNYCGFRTPILWLNTPAGAGFADIMPCTLMVYDAARHPAPNRTVSVERLNAESIILTGNGH